MAEREKWWQRRQSREAPSAAEEAEMQDRRAWGRSFAGAQDDMGTAPADVAGDMAPMKEPIGREQIHDATQILQRYKEGKANLEKKIVENEEWYKLRNWEQMRDKKSQVQPTSGWLLNAIINKHADIMSNFPRPNILPREEGDVAEAKMLSKIIPLILEQNDFEDTFDKEVTQKLKSGCGCFGVFWDNSRLNGLGDIAVKPVDLINLYWEPGINDIQDSQNVFSVALVDNDVLMKAYPNLKINSGESQLAPTKYLYDDTVDTSKKSAVVDWYYKKDGKLHLVKFVNDYIIYASENDPDSTEKGFYDHGLYPFVFDPCFRMEGTPAGFGYIDVGKSVQEYIDRGDAAIMQNMLANARPRFFIRDDGNVKEEEYADFTKTFIHTGSGMIADSVIPINAGGLSSIYMEILESKKNELKEVTSNRDVSTGGTSGGVTAASAIAALQEAGSKPSRDLTKGTFRAYRKVIHLVIELIRQFYDLPRHFRILGENGAAMFVAYDNARIQRRSLGRQMIGGDEMDMMAAPMFDIEVTAEKESPYTRLSNNELALQFYRAGFFAPQNAQMALSCLKMMDFDQKDEVLQTVMANYQLFLQTMAMAPAPAAGDATKEEQTNVGEESATTKNARERTNAMTEV